MTRWLIVVGLFVGVSHAHASPCVTDNENEEWNALVSDFMYGAEAATGAADTKTLDLAVGLHVGWMLSQRLGWTTSFGFQLRNRSDLADDYSLMENQFRLETGLQVWLGQYVWLRPSVGVVFGAFVADDPKWETQNLSLQTQQQSPPEFFVGGAASVTAGLVLGYLPDEYITISHKGVVQRPNVVGFVRVGNTFATELASPLRRGFILVGIAVQSH